MAFQGKVTPEMVEKFKRSRVDEVAPDIWRLEGFSGHPFNIELSSPNIYIFREGDTVLLTDTGLYPFYRERVLERLRAYLQKGCRKLILLNTHGHFDHVANNDLIPEAGFPETEFWLIETEKPVIDLLHHFEADLKEHEKYYNPHGFEPWIKGGDLYRGLNTMVDQAKIIPLSSRVTRRFGDVELQGWEVKRFFIIHDGAHTPGHVSFYDPKYKVLATGDLNMEIQPPFLDASLNRCIEVTDKFRRLANQGFVEFAMDCHRNSTFYPAIYEKCGVKPLSPAIVTGIARGKKECSEFFNVWYTYYTELKEEIFKIHGYLGEATVPDIVQEMRKSTNPWVCMKITFAYPNRPARLGTLVSMVLKEAGAKSRKEGDKILFSPVRR